jgi:CRISPR-associated protein (TIGR03986 family)
MWKGLAMALDEDGRKAVAYLLKRAPKELRSAESNRKQLINLLYDFDGDVEGREQEVIDAAAKQLVSVGAQAAIEKAQAVNTGSARPGGGQRAGGENHKRVTPRPDFNASLVQAPYRFITFSDTVVLAADCSTDRPPAFNKAPAGFFSGTIDVDWIAETPLLIGGAATAATEQNDSVEPIRIGRNGPYVIPGASLRGLVRSACEIIAFGRLPRGNWHHRYGLRDFDHPYYKDETTITNTAKVSGGMLKVRDWVEGADDAKFRVEPGKPGAKPEIWEILPASWEHLPVEQLNPANGISTPRDNKGWNGQELAEKYRLAKLHGNDGPTFKEHYSFMRKAVHRKDNREVVFTREGGEKGVLCFSGKLPGSGNKKFEYVFFPKHRQRAVPLPAVIVDDFLRLHTEPNKNKQVPAFSWKVLHKAARHPEGVPVFMVGDLNAISTDFFFGLTRLFKIPHKYSVEDVVRMSHAAHSDNRSGLESYEADLVENLFGYVVEPDDVLNPAERIKPDGTQGSINPAAVARRGRVAFGFATLSKQTPARLSAAAVDLIQMGPRGSFAPYYLKAAGAKDWSAGQIALAGRKAYLPRYQGPANAAAALEAIKAAGRAQIDAVTAQSKGKLPQGVVSHLKFLMPAGGQPLVFSQTLKLHNVSAMEIGMILYAITHGGDADKRFRHMLGRARPFGAGQMRVGAVRLAVSDNAVRANKGTEIPAAQPDELFDAATGKGLAAEGGQSVLFFIDKFIKTMDKFIEAMKTHDTAFPDVAPVREWLGTCNPAEGGKADAKLSYRPLPKDFGDLRKMVKLMDPAAGKPKEGLPRLLPAPAATPPKRNGA